MISSNEVKSLCLLGKFAILKRKVSLLKGCLHQAGSIQKKKCQGFLTPGTKQTVRIKRVSVKRGLTVEHVLDFRREQRRLVYRTTAGSRTNLPVPGVQIVEIGGKWRVEGEKRCFPPANSFTFVVLQNRKSSTKCSLPELAGSNCANCDHNK